MSSEYRLAEEIIARSNADTWDAAKIEWSLSEVYEAKAPETCLCGHSPIIELCVLGNKLNGTSVTAGNSCVKKFVGLPSDKIFQAVKRVRKDKERSLNGEAIGYAFQRGCINEWEKKFYSTLCERES